MKYVHVIRSIIYILLLFAVVQLVTTKNFMPCSLTKNNSIKIILVLVSLFYLLSGLILIKIDRSYEKKFGYIYVFLSTCIILSMSLLNDVSVVLLLAITLVALIEAVMNRIYKV
ncbi:hypothetical protein [Clostridium sp. YIM B02506]|uniref:hypothetical protein n=1 Tax=Clostridium sp. YIM B02506 TaxID=2910680 RepID=UPI001EED6A58|nr:hypothetical protein [Clostridium sp. YIM B02506]